MPVPSGSQIGSYEIISLLGVGGMGQVYRARDPRLGRVVAVKVLTYELTADAGLIERFKREARILASLNHPNIATIYGVEDIDGSNALVMELVEGETLAERLVRQRGRPVPLAEVLGIARQIADALDAAQEKGIVHRDLKPANVMISSAGTVKVLDFGIAKVQADAAAALDGATAQKDMTEHGTLLGTGPYMSPEQARGVALDKRSDIWAFGCVLYELLTGQRAFRGATPQDVLAAILERDPDWSALPATTPPGVKRLLRRCLEKDPRRRMRDIGDARAELEDVESRPGDNVTLDARSSWPRRALAAVVLGVALTASGLWAVRGRDEPAPPQRVTRLSIQTPAYAPLARQTGGFFSRFGNGSLSPDGSRFVYVAALPTGGTQLYQRAFDELGARPIAGTEGASAPFFSPDGAAIGFFAEGNLKRVPSDGGSVTIICRIGDAAAGGMGAWGRDGAIVFGVSPSAREGLFRVSDGGGTPEALPRPELHRGVSYGDPWLIDGAQAVLFVTREASAPSSVSVLSMESGEQRTLVEGFAERPIYTATGHLMYLAGSVLMAARFDATGLKRVSEPIKVLEDVGASTLSLASNGRLAYSVPERPSGRLVWVNRDGAVRPLPTERLEFSRPRLSPDEQRLATEVRQGTGVDIGVFRFDNQALALLSRSGANSPSWSRDGSRIIFRVGVDIVWWVAGSAEEPQPLASPADLPVDRPGGLAPGEWTPDQTTYVFVRQGSSSTGADIWAMRVNDGERRFEPLVERPRNQWSVRVSPDGRWMSYASDESGRYEIYVHSLDGDRREQISADGGWQAVWGRDGREIFYRSGDRMMVVPVTTTPTFDWETPRELFSGAFASTDLANYDVTSDGQRFVMVEPNDEAEGRTIQLVDHWLEELERLVPEPSSDGSTN